MSKKAKILSVLLTSILLLSACAPPSPPPQLTATASATLTLTSPPPTLAPSYSVPTKTLSPTSTITPTPTAIPSSWGTYSDPTLKLEFRYPAEWTRQLSLTLTTLTGTDGFLEISLRHYPTSEFEDLRTPCLMEANFNDPAAYGPFPMISDWFTWDPAQQSQARFGCTVTASELFSSDGSSGQAVLYARFPSSLMPGHLLVIRGDQAHFAAILSTLRFTDAATPTPASRALDTPACLPDRNQQPQEIMNTANLVVTETAIASSACDPLRQFDGFQTILKSVDASAEFARAAAKALRQVAALDNAALASFGYRLEEDPGTPLSFSLFQGDTLVIGGLATLGQVSVNPVGDDFVLWAKPADGMSSIEGRKGQTHTHPLGSPSFNTAWVGSDLMAYDYSSAPLFPGGAPSQVAITRNGAEVNSLSVPQPGPAGTPVERFWSWNGHWMLEMNSIVVQDGQALNQNWEYPEVFGWNLMNGEPFFFFQKNSRYGINYDGRMLLLRYDDIIHGRLCCDYARYNISTSPTDVWFFALREEVWYLVHVQVMLTVDRNRS